MGGGLGESPHLPYAVADTDASRDLQSLDREMTARLCRVYGICLPVFALLIVGLSLPGAAAASRATRGPSAKLMLIAFAIPALAYFVPGIVLLFCVRPLHRQQRATAIAVLVAALW